MTVCGMERSVCGMKRIVCGMVWTVCGMIRDRLWDGKLLSINLLFFMLNNSMYDRLWDGNKSIRDRLWDEIFLHTP